MKKLVKEPCDEISWMRRRSPMKQRANIRWDENDLSGSHAADLMGVDHGERCADPGAPGEKKTGNMVCCGFRWMEQGGSEKRRRSGEET